MKQASGLGRVPQSPDLPVVDPFAQEPEQVIEDNSGLQKRACDDHNLGPRLPQRPVHESAPEPFTPSQEEENIEGDDDDLEARHLPPMCDIFNRR